MRTWAIVTAAAALAAPAIGCGGDDGGDTGPVKIALLAPQSGALQFVGESFARVANVAVASINDLGGIDGRELELTIADTQTDPAVAKTQLEQLIADGIVAVVGPATSGEVTECYPTAAQLEVPIVSPSSTAPSLSAADIQDDGYMFRNVPDDSVQGIAMAYYLGQASSTPITAAHVLYEDTPYGSGLAGAFKLSFEKPAVGGDVVDEVTFTQNLAHRCCAAAAASCGDASCTSATDVCGTTGTAVADLPKLCPGPDAIAAIDALAALDPVPQTVVMIALEQDAVELALAWDNEGNPKIPGLTFFMTDGARSSGFLNGAPDSIRGMCGTAPTFPVTGLAYRALEQKYEMAYDDNLADQVFAPNVWDGFHLVAAAMVQQANEHSGEALGGEHLRDALTTVSKGGQKFHAGQWRDLISAIRSGNDVDYDGAAGPNDFNIVGQTIGPYEVWCIAGDGSAFEQELFLNADEIQALGF